MEIFDRPGYAKLALRKASAFREAKPFPHIMFDNFLSPDIVDAVARSYPDPTADMGWTKHSNLNAKRMFLGDETKVNPWFRQFMQATASRQFLLFLETLSGIKGLIPDPYYIGGGAMVAGRGDYLNMHCDFNFHYRLKCYRRLNALFYLTPDWKEEWGGDLRLEPANADDVTSLGSGVGYSPLFNRVIIFEVSDTAWHGQPEPMTCPEGAWRRVFSAFYYTSWSTKEEQAPHLTVYKQTTPYTEKPIIEYQGDM
jgi:hypothetical protein